MKSIWPKFRFFRAGIPNREWPAFFIYQLLFAVLALLYATAIYRDQSRAQIALAALGACLRFTLLSLLVEKLFAVRRRARRLLRFLFSAGLFVGFLSYFSFAATQVGLWQNYKIVSASLKGVQAVAQLFAPLVTGSQVGLLALTGVICFVPMLFANRVGVVATRPRTYGLLCLALIADQALAVFIKAPQAWGTEKHYLPLAFFQLPTALSRVQPFSLPLVAQFKDDLCNQPQSPHLDLAARPKRIVVFIVETLPLRFVNAQQTPAMWSLRSTSLRGHLSLAAANVTQLSWQAIFTGRMPLTDWQRHAPTCGALPLKLLQQADYQIQFFDSAGFNYLDMQKRITGDLKGAVPVYRPAPKDLYQWDKTDVQMTEAFVSAVPQDRVASASFLFYGATHFPYLSPENSDSPQRSIDLLAAQLSSRARQGIVDRYVRALKHVDTQIGKVLDSLKSAGVFDDSIIVLVGDHGEEFFEKGNFGHGSALVSEQVEVPIYLKLQNQRHEAVVPMLSHVDVMPTLMRALGIGDDNSRKRWFQGQVKNQAEPGHLEALVVNGRGYPQYPNEFVWMGPKSKVWFDLARTASGGASAITLRKVTSLDDVVERGGDKMATLREVSKQFCDAEINQFNASNCTASKER